MLRENNCAPIVSQHNYLASLEFFFNKKKRDLEANV